MKMSPFSCFLRRPAAKRFLTFAVALCAAAAWTSSPTGASAVPDASAAASSVARAVAGRILLDVERNGEAWYVEPLTSERHFLGRPADAFRVMRELGLGISNANLAVVPEHGGADEGDVALRRRLSGRILLQVEAYGEAWYVDPVTLRRHFLGRPADAFLLMRELGLGISSADLATVPVADGVPVSVIRYAPFAAQAPLGDWSDRREQEGCEEASALMAVAWARGEAINLTEAQRVIEDLSDWQAERFGHYEDTSARDTADRIIKGYFKHEAVEVREGIGADDVRRALADGETVVLVPVDGRKLGNPHFTPPGPLRHMILVTGYDAGTDEFITNEPGTRYGEAYRYSRVVLAEALMDYPSGYHEPLTPERTAMVVVRKE